MNELWKSIDGYEYLYKVSNTGKIRSFHKRVIDLKFGLSNSGYYIAHLRLQGVRQAKYVHRLVALAFIGAIPKNLEVMHLDGNKLNNHVDNLRYGTRSCNCAFKVDDGTDTIGERHGCAKLANADIVVIRQLHTNGVTGASLARKFNVTESNISLIINNKSRVYA